MGGSFRNWVLIVLFFVALPGFFADRALTILRDESNRKEREELFQDMEDVLHRILRRGAPEFSVKALVDRAFKYGRSEKLLLQLLERLQKSYRNQWEFFLFDRSGKPVPFGGSLPDKISARQRVFRALLEAKFGGKTPSKTDEKLSQQILGDKSAILNLAKSRGHLRKLGSPIRYSFGGLWEIPGGGSRKFLLVMVRKDGFPSLQLLKQAVKVAGEKCRKFFDLTLVGDERSPSFAKLPEEVREVLAGSSARQDVFVRGAFQGAFLACQGGMTALASNRNPLSAGKTMDDLRVLVCGLGMFFALVLMKLVVIGNPTEISLRWAIPFLILGATLPALGYLGMSMTEQRKRVLEKETYEAHRNLENSLVRIDQGFYRELETLAQKYQEILAEFCQNPLTLGMESGSASAVPEIAREAYIFDQDGKISRTLKSNADHPADSKALAGGFVAKLTDAVYGRAPIETFEDPILPHYLKHLGWFTEIKLLDEYLSQFVEMRPVPQTGGMLGIFVSHLLPKLVRLHLRKVLRNPADRGNAPFAIVAFDGETLLGSIPRSFLRNPDGMRIAERVLQTGKAVDGTILNPTGQRLLLTAFPGRRLDGFILVAGSDPEPLNLGDHLLVDWTWKTAGVLILIAFFSAGFLVRKILGALRVLTGGIDRIRSKDFLMELPLEGTDEFAQLARGIEKAGVTLEEIFSSLPVQETLVRCEPFKHPNIRTGSIFFPCEEPGGDFLDGFPTSDGKFLFAIGDVLGEGWQTTLVTAAIRMGLRVFAERGFASLTDLGHRLNRHFIGFRGSNRRMTILLGLLDPDNGDLECVGGGHCLPILLGRDGPAWLPRAGLPLGSTGKKAMEAFSRRLSPGDSLLLYTDGWAKTSNPASEPLGYERFLRIAGDLKGTSPDEKLLDLEKGIIESGFSKSPEDDRSALLISFGREREGGK